MFCLCAECKIVGGRWFYSDSASQGAAHCQPVASYIRLPGTDCRVIWLGNYTSDFRATKSKTNPCSIHSLCPNIFLVSCHCHSDCANLVQVMDFRNREIAQFRSFGQSKLAQFPLFVATRTTWVQYLLHTIWGSSAFGVWLEFTPVVTRLHNSAMVFLTSWWPSFRPTDFLDRMASHRWTSLA